MSCGGARVGDIILYHARNIKPTLVSRITGRERALSRVARQVRVPHAFQLRCMRFHLSTNRLFAFKELILKIQVNNPAERTLKKFPKTA